MTSSTLTPPLAERIRPTRVDARRDLWLWTAELVSGVVLAYFLVLGLSPYVVWPTSFSMVGLLGLAALTAVWALLGQRVQFGWSMPALGLMLAFGAVSTLGSVDPVRSWNAWWQILTYGAVFTLCAGVFAGERWQRAIHVVLWAGLLTMAWHWAQAIGWYRLWLEINPGEWLPTIPYRLPNPNTTALQLVLLMIATVAHLGRPSGPRRWWLIPYLASLAGLLFLTSSRGGWLGGLAGLTTLAALGLRQDGIATWLGRAQAWRRRHAIASMAVLFAGLTGLAVGGGVLWMQLDQPSRGGRFEFWGPALATFVAHPVWGQGPATFAVSYMRSQTAPPTMVYNQAHSLYLNTLAEGGAAGLIAGGLLAAALAAALFQRRRGADAATSLSAAMALAALIAFGTHGVVDTVTFDKGNVLILALLSASGLGAAARPARRLDVVAAIPGVLAALALGLGLYGVWRDDPAHRGVALAAANDWDGAVAAFTDATDRNPGSPAAWQQLGLAQAWASDPADPQGLRPAIASLERAAALDPAWPANALNLGVLYRAVGDQAQARVWLERAVALAPRVALSHVNLGLTLEAQGFAGEARAAYAQALALAPAQAVSSFWLETAVRSAALAENGGPDSGGPTSGLAVATTRGVSDVYLAEAEAALAAGDIDQAEHWLAMGELGLWVQPEARLDWAWRLAEVRQLRGDSAEALMIAGRVFELADSASSFGPGVDGGAVYGTYVALAPTMPIEFVPQVFDLGATVDWPERRAQAHAWCAELAPDVDRPAVCLAEAQP